MNSITLYILLFFLHVQW